MAKKQATIRQLTQGAVTAMSSKRPRPSQPSGPRPSFGFILAPCPIVDESRPDGNGDETIGNRLCAGDMVRVLTTGGAGAGLCKLGRFVPYTK